MPARCLPEDRATPLHLDSDTTSPLQHTEGRMNNMQDMQTIRRQYETKHQNMMGKCDLNDTCDRQFGTPHTVERILPDLQWKKAFTVWPLFQSWKISPR